MPRPPHRPRPPTMLHRLPTRRLRSALAAESGIPASGIQALLLLADAAAEEPEEKPKEKAKRGRPFKKKGTRKRKRFSKHKGGAKRSVAPAAILLPARVEVAPAAIDVAPEDPVEPQRRCQTAWGRKGRSERGIVPITQGARVTVRPIDPRPWAAPRVPDPPSKPPPVTPTQDSYSELLNEEPSPVITPQARRLAIACYFLETMDAPPAQEDAATVTWMLKHLVIPDGSRFSIKQVIEDVRCCHEEGVEYTGEKTGSDRMMLARIKPNSVAALIIAELMEARSGQ
jgi:hypothetical protein